MTSLRRRVERKIATVAVISVALLCVFPVTPSAYHPPLFIAAVAWVVVVAVGSIYVARWAIEEASERARNRKLTAIERYAQARLEELGEFRADAVAVAPGQ